MFTLMAPFLFFNTLLKWINLRNEVKPINVLTKRSNSAHIRSKMKFSDQRGEKRRPKFHDSNNVDNKEEKRPPKGADLVSPHCSRSCYQEIVFKFMFLSI